MPFSYFSGQATRGLSSTSLQCPVTWCLLFQGFELKKVLSCLKLSGSQKEHRRAEPQLTLNRWTSPVWRGFSRWKPCCTPGHRASNHQADPVYVFNLHCLISLDNLMIFIASIYFALTNTHICIETLCCVLCLHTGPWRGIAISISYPSHEEVQYTVKIRLQNHPQLSTELRYHKLWDFFTFSINSLGSQAPKHRNLLEMYLIATCYEVFTYVG